MDPSTLSPHVRQMVALIEEGFAQRLSLRVMARAVGRQEAYLGRLFRQQMGMSAHEYTARVRMERAVTLIGKGDKVEAVALQVGYRSKKNFYRQFTIRFGVTPAAYRVRTLTAAPNQQCEIALLKNLSFRSIGPAVSGGPVVALAGVEGRPSTLYVGTAGGGLWKTVNNGTTWQPVFESKNGAGNLTVTAADADLIWIANSNDLCRSTDGGRTWTDVGRSDWRRVGRIVVDPKHCDTVYVAVSGGRTGADPNRGLYKTTDAGLSWTRVLFIDEYTGIADVLLDPTDSQTLLATAGARRHARANGYGGDAGQIGGVYKTSDGGSSWRRVTSGLPAGNARRITLGLCSRTPRVAYAAIESADGGIYRSCDSGETWRRLNVPNVNAARISDIKVDPRNHRTVYVASDRLYVSDDGGDTFSTGQSPCAVRTIWIDPFDPERIAIGADSGLYMSYDHGATWQVCQNLPIASFTRIGADMRKPYRLFCSSHAAGTWAGPHSARTRDGVSSKDWFRLPGEGSFVQVDPTDPNLVYTAGHGQLARHDLETGEVKFIHPDPGNYGASAHRRVSILISRHHTSTLFAGLASIYKSTDRGLTWTVISRALGVPPERGQRSPGETRTSRSLDTATAPMVNVLAESARASGLLYAGLSNGNVLLTRDGGRTWTNVTGRFTAVPKTRVVSCIATSAHEANTAYVTFDARQSEDYAPYVFTTTDGGRSWTSIASNLPGGPVNAVREDPRNPQLLYAGTECGLFVSLDRGAQWERLENDLPAVAINDVLLHPRENDLVVSTRGRGIWILDDIAPLQELAGAMATAAAAFLFSIRPVVQRAQRVSDTDGRFGAFTARNAPEGAVITYCLKEAAAERIRVVISDATGTNIRELDGSGDRGVNRVAWDLRLPPSKAHLPQGPSSNAGCKDDWLGALIAPGEYRVTLSIGRHPFGSRAVRVEGDPYAEISEAAQQQRHTVSVLTAIQDAVSELATLLRTFRSEVVRLRQTEFKDANVFRAAQPEVRAIVVALADLQRHVGSVVVEDEPVQATFAATNWPSRTDGASTQQPARSPAAIGMGSAAAHSDRAAVHSARATMRSYGLRTRVRRLKAEVAASWSAPTAVQTRAVQQLSDDVTRVMTQLRTVVIDRLMALNRLLEQHGVPAIHVPALRTINEALAPR